MDCQDRLLLPQTQIHTLYIQTTATAGKVYSKSQLSSYLPSQAENKICAGSGNEAGIVEAMALSKQLVIMAGTRKSSRL
jgi:hypothetical protein